MRSTLPSPALVDSETLADVLGVSVQVVHRLGAARRIPRYKIGHRLVRFDLQEVLDTLREPADVAGSRDQRSLAERQRAAAARVVCERGSPLGEAPSLPHFDWEKKRPDPGAGVLSSPRQTAAAEE